MAHGPLTFKERDVRAAVKAVVDAGCAVVRVEIDKAGKIVILTGDPSKAELPSNEWDIVYGSQAV